MGRKNLNNVEINVDFNEASSRQSLNSGDEVKTLFGKIKKWLSDLKAVAFSGSYNDLSNKPTSLPANGGNAATVNNKTVQSNVPENAVFTDTVYDDTALSARVTTVEGTSHTHSNKTILDNTTASYTSAEKTKLGGIAAGAQVNTITGVKGNSESTYRTGNVNITPANIGLGNVNNTADSAKNVLSASKLTTPRTLSLTGNVTGNVSFDGSANASMTTTVLNSATVNNKTVQSNVPENAVFTDTVYDDTALSARVTTVEGTSHTHSNKTILDNTTASYTSAEKTKLGGIAAGAQVNTITGVKGNSESTYRTGNVNITPANIGLGNVNNTADSAKNVLSASKLTTPRTLSLTGNVTGNVSFDGSANASMTTTVLNSATVNNKTVQSNVPENAVFTDTVYDDTALSARVTTVEGTSHTHSNKTILDNTTASYTSAEKTKLGGIAAGAQVNTITGVKGNSESTYRTGNVNITPANIGLGNVNNTADSAKNVLSASKLTTPRTLSLTGNVTGNVSFDGSANASMTTTVLNSAAATTALACSGNAASATKLATARTIQLTGAVTGSATFNGTANCSIATTLASTGSKITKIAEMTFTATTQYGTTEATAITLNFTSSSLNFDYLICYINNNYPDVYAYNYCGSFVLTNSDCTNMINGSNTRAYIHSTRYYTSYYGIYTSNYATYFKLTSASQCKFFLQNMNAHVISLIIYGVKY